MAKGIRVNQLAKELSVPSKMILDKCRDEGLGEKVPNHMSLLSLGLAETVREWFHHGAGGGTAIETAAPVDVAVATKTKTSRRRRKTESSVAAQTQPPVEGVAAEPDGAASAATSAAESAAATQAVPKKTTRTRPRRAAAPAAIEQEIPAAPISPPEAPQQTIAVEAPAAPPSSTTDQIAPPAAPGVAAEEVAPEAPAAPPAQAAGPAVQMPEPPVTSVSAEAAAAAAPPSPPTPAAAPPQAQAHSDQLRPTRPTISLSNRASAPLPTAVSPHERKPVTPVARLVTPAPARIQGPRVVREERPENLPAPRPRRLLSGGPSGTSQTPSFTQARPLAGRGVRIIDEEEEGSSAAGRAARKGAVAKKGGSSLSSRRRGPDGRRGEAMEKLKEYTEADLIERRDRLAAASAHRTAFDSHLKKSAGRGMHEQAKPIVQRGQPVELEEPITVRTLSAALGVKGTDIISRLMKQGVFATINQSLDRDVAELIADGYGVELRIQQVATLEQQLEQEFAASASAPQNLTTRPPVVTILGHVDHGKTSLLDRIRNTNVAAGEAGGITQHTAAWMVELNGKRVTFIDTPGHQAFTSMRARGAQVTDVVVLVVSAAEGVQPQTIESINHARAAGVPIVVALNKIDRPDANPDMVLGQLAKEGLNPVEWGGDTEVVRTSAVTGQGMSELIELLDYQAELLELKTNPTAPARGTVIESRMDEGMGAVATVLVQDGVLHVGDVVLAGPGYGRIRSLLNDRGEPIEQAGASMPVIVSGLGTVPAAGDRVYSVDDMELARSIAEDRTARMRQDQLAQQNRVSSDNLLATIAAGEIQTIHLIVKADVQGSVETLDHALAGIGTDEVKVRVIHSGVGAISESDVQLAMATRINSDDPTEPRKVAIIGFHVVADEAARVLAEQNHVDIKTYRVIYEIFDDLKKAMTGMLAPEIREKLHGHAEIRQVFKVSRLGNIAGCFVTDGHIQRGSRLRLVRDGRVVTQDLSIDTLRRVKDDVREVRAGLECGLKIAGYDDIKVGDVLEAYVRETVQRTL